MLYIADHWTGNHPLWRAYWVNNILLSILLSLLIGPFISATASVLAAAMGLVFIVALNVWGLVGVWRSAGFYVKEHRFPRAFLGWLAYFACILGWLKLALAFLF